MDKKAIFLILYQILNVPSVHEFRHFRLIGCQCNNIVFVCCPDVLHPVWGFSYIKTKCKIWLLMIENNVR